MRPKAGRAEFRVQTPSESKDSWTTKTQSGKARDVSRLAEFNSLTEFNALNAKGTLEFANHSESECKLDGTFRCAPNGSSARLNFGGLQHNRRWADRMWKRSAADEQQVMVSDLASRQKLS